MGKGHQVRKTTLIIVICTILVKIMGAGRDLVLSYFYGSTAMSDAYILATTLPLTIFAFIYEGIGASFIPACAKLESSKEENRLTSNMINLLLCLTAALVLLVELFPEFTVKLFASGFSGETLETAVYLTRVSMLGVFFSSVVYVLHYYLNYHDSFLIPTIRAIPMDFVVIASIVISSATGNVFPLAIGIPISILAELLLLLPFARKKGFSYSLTLDIKDKNIHNIILWSLPVIVSTAVVDLNSIVDRQFASWLIEGGISALTYSSRTLNAVRTMLFIPVISVLFPIFSRYLHDGDKEKVSQITSKTLCMLALVAIPLTVATVYMASDIVTLLFQRGAFDAQAAVNTATCLKYYAFALVGYAVIAITTKIFYAMTDMKTPMKISVVGVIINIGLNFLLSNLLGLKGLAIATSVSTIVMALLQYIILNRRLHFHNRHLLITAGKSIIASGVMAAAIVALRTALQGRASLLATCLCVTVAGVIVYALVLLLLKTGELKEMLRMFKRK